VWGQEWDNADPQDAYAYYLMSEATDTIYRTWMCVVCGFIYDEAAGLPEEGIAPGTRWEDIPDTWTCPDCGVTKDDFEMMEVE
jgi:rubredoxin